MNLKRSAILVALAIGLQAGGGHAVELEVDDSLEDLTRAKVAKQRAKQNTQRRSLTEDSAGDGGGGCGNIDIGNSQGGRPGFSGPKEIIVVVKGDIINSNNKCKD